MSLEQAILDRLEKRNGQIAQLQSTVHALERAADVEREHARQQLAPLIEENKKLAAQVDSEVAERRERLIKSLNDEITKRDHELRAHEKELAEQREEIRAIIETATYCGMTSDEGVGNFIKRKCIESEEVRDEIIRAETNLELVRRECEQIRREVPLESTREGLKNAVAKLQEVTTDRDRVRNELAAILAEANKSGRCGGDPVALIKQGQVDRDTAESLDRQLGAALALSNERAQEIRKLIDGHAEDMKAQAELLSKYESLLAKTTDLGSYAMTIGRKEGEPLEMFMERQALRLAALESKTGPSIDFQIMANNLVGEVAKLKVKLGAFEKMYEIIKVLRHEQKIMAKYKQVYAAVDDVTEALSQLTA